MANPPAYERDPCLTLLDTVIVGTGIEDGRPWAALADTVLYPEGGGQPSDRGWIGEVAVVEVRRAGGVLRHYLETAVTAGPVRVTLDWERRFDHMQQHTAQHLLTAVAADRFGWSTTAFHLGAGVSDVELDAPAIPAGHRRELEEAVAAEVRAAHPVTAVRVTPEALAELGVRSRGLPADHEGDVRLVRIEGVDLNTCGGTHVRSTAELEAVALLATEPMRGGTRLTFVAGRRLRARLARHEDRNAELRTLLGAPDDELAAVTALRAEQLRAADRGMRALEDDLVQALVEDIARRPGPVVGTHFADRDMGFLTRLARLATGAAPDKVVLLTSGPKRAGIFALAFGDGLGVDPRETGARVAALLSGRGGGSGRVFQGKAGDLGRRDEALAALREALAGPAGA